MTLTDSLYIFQSLISPDSYSRAVWVCTASRCKSEAKHLPVDLQGAFQLDSGGTNASLIWSISAIESNLSSLLNIEKQQLLRGCEVSITFAPQRDAAVTWCWWIYEYVIWQEGGFKNNCCNTCLVITLSYFPWLGHLYFSTLVGLR